MAWKGMRAIAETLNTYLENYIIRQYEYDKKDAFAEDIDLLHKEVTVAVNRIQCIMERL